MDSARTSSQSHRFLVYRRMLWIGLTVIASVAEAQEPPVCQCMDLVFLQDVTVSMSSLDHVRNELQQVLDLAEAEVPDGLRAGVISFGDTIFVDQQLTADLDHVRAVIAGMEGQNGHGGPEPSDEALREALTESICEPCAFQEDLVIGDFDASYRRNCRKLAVLVTDYLPAGCNDQFNSGDTVLDDVNAHLRAMEALAKEVQIAAVLVGSGTGTVEIIMRDYAETTGGIFVRVGGTQPEISDALASFIAECVDCNLDNTVDPVDLAKGVPDCDDNDVPDVCQQDVFCTTGFPAACQPPTDCNSNSTPDLCEIRDGSPDCDLNGVIDSCEPNCNNNSLPDECGAPKRGRS